MGVPKNFQKTVNLSNRVNALNDLTFYLYEYNVTLTSKIVNEIYDNNKSFGDLEQFLGEMDFIGDKVVKCKNRVSALNRKKADVKLTEWLGKAIDTGIIEDFDIVKVIEKTFNEEVEEQGLTEILKYKRD
tara:strand:+ start:1759 stop:2148 length:390 start_codon:yes stop_codon:yes gene_type:complete